MRIGVNALYLIPGGVGGTEIYLRGLLAALAELDAANRYFVFTNRETGSDLVPKAFNFETVAQPVRAVSRPARILWEQTALPLAAVRLRLDVLLNPGFTAPLACPCPQVTVFHDLQHKRHPEYFRKWDLPFWRFLLYWSARISRLLLADSEATAADLRRFYRVPEDKIRVVPLGVDPVFFDLARRRFPSLSCWRFPPSIRTRTWMACCARSPFSAAPIPISGWWCAASTASLPDRCTICGKASAWKPPSHSPAGFHAPTYTISTRAPRRFSTPRFSKVSACRWWKPWPLRFPRRVPMWNRWPASPAMPRCNSIRAIRKP